MAYIIAGLIIIALGGFMPLLFKKGSALGSRLAVLAVLAGEILIVSQTIPSLLCKSSIPMSYHLIGLSLVLDSLSAVFLLMVSIISGIIAVYAEGYLRPYREGGSDTRVNLLFFNLLIVAMSLLFLVTDAITFLTVWEIMSLASFMLIIFHHEQSDVRKAGLKYFVTMHVGFVFLAGGFLGAGLDCGSMAFKNIAVFFGTTQSNAIPWIILLFVGFAFKAGFIPVHFWLPDAHPAAPTHVSALMSGVMIKTGIYGILRTTLLFSVQSLNWGLIFLGIGVFSGIYGILHALSQRDIKKMLAYSSVENIGIIGLGIGAGMIGKATGNEVMAVLGFAGALLHTVNHSIFKSLLFSGVGVVYQATHTRDLEHLGGLIKKLPWTARGFLAGTAAISGLPPLNGFIGEFLIYVALFCGVKNNALIIRFPAMVAIIALVLIGGLAIACFTKLYGMVFLGLARRPKEIKNGERLVMILPLLILTGLILVIGLFPLATVSFFAAPIRQISGIDLSIIHHHLDILKSVNLTVWIFLLIFTVLVVIRQFCFKTNTITVENTWGCGYAKLNPRMEYTGSSLVNSITFLFGRILERDVIFEKPEGLFPDSGIFRSTGKDKIEETGIQPLIDWMRLFLQRFSWIQHGNLQHYIWYGLIFMVITIIFALRG